MSEKKKKVKSQSNQAKLDTSSNAPSHSPPPPQPTPVVTRAVAPNTKTPSDDSLRSSTDMSITTQKTPKILVYCRVFENHEISFYINVEQRPDTKFVGQGDHTTSYFVILETLLTSTDRFGLRQSISCMTALIQNLLEIESSKLPDDYPKLPAVHSHEDRKYLTELLKSDSQLSSKTGLINDELINAKLNSLGNHLADLATFFLTKMQKKQFTTFYSKGRINKKENEGNKTKAASRALIALDKLCEIESLSREPLKIALDSIIKSLEKLAEQETQAEHVLRYGLNAWKTTEISPDEIITKLDQQQSIDDKKAVLLQVKEEILKQHTKLARFFGDLLDYSYILKFNLNEAITLTKSERKKKSSEKIEVLETKIKNIFLESDHSYAFTNEKINGNNIRVAKIKRTDFDKLCQILDNHMKIISSALPNLEHALVEKGVKEKVYDFFFENVVLVDEGWNQLKFFDDNMTMQTCDLSRIKEKLQLFSTSFTIPKP